MTSAGQSLCTRHESSQSAMTVGRCTQEKGNGMTQMSKRHFELIAEVLADVRGYYAPTPSQFTNDEIHGNYVLAFADALAETNPRFDRIRFIEAAGA